jgi:hypothetical protein
MGCSGKKKDVRTSRTHRREEFVLEAQHLCQPGRAWQPGSSCQLLLAVVAIYVRRRRGWHFSFFYEGSANAPGRSDPLHCIWLLSKVASQAVQMQPEYAQRDSLMVFGGRGIRFDHLSASHCQPGGQPLGEVTASASHPGRGSGFDDFLPCDSILK